VDADPDRWADPKAWPYTFELLNVEHLFVDDRYQRPLTKIADSIASGFDRALLEPLLVSKRARNRYAIADGQNRWAGTTRIGERWLWCRVMRLSPQEEARIFSQLQAQRKGIRPLERYKADVFAGDPEAVAVARLLKRHGIKTNEVSGAFGDEDSLAAITAVRRRYSQYGEQHMSRVFDTIKAAYPDTRGRYSSELINSLSTFFTRNPDANMAQLIFALTERIGSLHELLARSAAKRRSTGTGMGGGSQVYTVQVIEEAYRAAGRGAFRGQWEHT
jgi:hypothetical protein